MNRNLIISAVVLFLLGAGAIAVIATRGGDDPAANEQNKPGASASTVRPSSASGTNAGARKATRTPREIRDTDLVDRYGQSKTNLSRQVTGNVVTLLEDAIKMGEMMQEAGRRGNWGGGRWATRAAMRGTGIELTEEQQNQMAELYREFRGREMEQFKDAVNSLKKDPSALMELLLAGDSRKRDEMTQDEYETIISSVGDDLSNVTNPLDWNNAGGGRPMDDETFRTDFVAILDDDQSAAFNSTLAEREAAAKAAAGASGEASRENAGNITNLPTMELETLDQAVVSARKMASGLQQVMEGMGSLRDLRPQVEPESNGE